MQTFSFSVSFMRFWLRGRCKIDSSIIGLNLPHTVLWLIPAGHHNESIPLKNISSIKHNFYISGLELLIGIGLTWLAGSDLVSGRLTAMIVVVFLLGILLICDAFRVVVEVEKSGQSIAFRMPFYEATKAKRLVQIITAQLRNDTDKTDLGLYFDRKES